jgi:hypothetical protein
MRKRLPLLQPLDFFSIALWHDTKRLSLFKSTSAIGLLIFCDAYVPINRYLAKCNVALSLFIQAALP